VAKSGASLVRKANHSNHQKTMSGISPRGRRKLAIGPAELVTYLYDEHGDAGGAYFTEVEFIR